MKRKQGIRRISAALIGLVAALSCALAPACATSDSSAGDSLIVGVPVDRCPVFYLNADANEVTGIGTDLMRAAAEAAGFTVTFKRMEEDTLKEALDNEGYDLVMPFGSAISSASGRPSVVSEDFIQMPFTLVTQGHREPPPLNGLRVGMLRTLGGAAETVRELYPSMEITLYETMPECVKALRNNQVDALLHNSYVWSYVLQRPSYSDLVVQPAAMFSMGFQAGTLDTPQGRALIERLNGGIASITDAKRQAIILDHTSRRLYRYDLSDYINQYGLAIPLIALLVASLVVILVQMQREHRREQEERVRQLIDHDPLTGLYSMSGFWKRVEELLRAHPNTPYFLSYNNIRDFKFINDSLGREAGDQLLKSWASQSQSHLTDEEAIGRIEADHFAALRHIEGEEKMRLEAKNVFEPVRDFFLRQGKENRVLI